MLFFSYRPTTNGPHRQKIDLYLAIGEAVTIAKLPENLVLSDGWVFVQKLNEEVVGPVWKLDLKPIPKKS